ncbi:hypothetical protein Ddye_003794 [Dipteronia dyeriana]|uniref:Extra-large guanine nucleotide-binding protein 1-like n=1 Tax=Dipteronia dyeriana TaxID=168575 RepID=A0AAD9XTD7_9ROSI|nr:hypothetical protein Ddye_003794 [Dipteronia dyeriana]
MAGILRKFLPVVQPSPKRGDDDVGNDTYNDEYSFAIEYSGPVSNNIPRVLPIVFDQIPVAAPVASSSLSSDSSLPVVQPIVRHNRLKEPKLSSESLNAPCVSGEGESSTRVDSSDALGSATGADGKFKLCYGISSGKLECSDDQDNLSEILDCKAGDECIPVESEVVGGSGKLESSSKLKCPDDQDNSSEILDCTAGDECMLTVSEVGEGSCKQETSHCHDTSHDDVELPNNSQEGAVAGFHDYMNPANSESTESGLSSRSLSSEVFSCKEEYCNNEESRGHVKKLSAVTFLEPDTSDTVYEESVYSEAESNNVKPKAERNGKKGSCYRCLKGIQFTVKEACIVCGAKYCSNCVVRAMGSMPEGRKCVPCIGFRIDEANRRNLGKSSWMLKRLLNDMEVKQIMKAEISCLMNQLPPEQVCVNGEPLSQNQLVMLQGCPNPPKKLTPGNYWYDKVSGLWGKDGYNPCQIISSQLEVGGHLKAEASNGNTNVYVNNRQITRKELYMLKAAGEQCEGYPHFWLSADGSYQEEGQNHVKGNIWDKKRTKLVCALLSLPTPTDNTRPCGDDVNAIGYNYLELKKLHKLFLVGDKKSGTSTIYKQAKLIFNVPFSEDERQNIKLIIQSNLYRYIAILLEGRERFEEESLTEKWKQVVDPSSYSGQSDEKTMYSIGQRLKAFSDWLLKVMVSGNLEAIFPAATREYAPFVEELWKDMAFQATYNRRNELDMLPRVATYFLERAVEISRPIYEPSDMDILYAEGVTSSNGLCSMEFSFPKSTQESFADAYTDQNNPLFRYQLIRVHPRSLGENCKWLEMFEDVDIVLFSVSLTEYDELVEDSNGNPTNKMLMSKQLFESIVTHPRFNEKDFLLLLNKYDLLEEKMEQVPLTKCEWFHDFNPVISINYSRRTGKTSLAQYAFHYIAVKFKILFQDLSGHKLFVSQVTGLEPDSVGEALKYASEILKWEEEEHSYTHNDLSSFTDYEPNSSA